MVTLPELFVRNDIISDAKQLAKAASALLKKQEDAKVQLPIRRSGASDIRGLLREALSGDNKLKYLHPADSARHRSELIRLAALQSADFEVLGEIMISEGARSVVAKTKRMDSLASKKIVLEAIKELGFDLKNLDSGNGRSGSKSKVKAQVGNKLSESQFKHAWDAVLELKKKKNSK